MSIFALRITSLRSVILVRGTMIKEFFTWFYKSKLLTPTLKKFFVGRAGFEPAKVKTNRFTVCPRWPLEYLPLLFFGHSSRWRDSNPRPADYKSAALAS